MPEKLTVKTVFEAIDKSTKVIGKIQGKLAIMSAKGAMGMRKLDRAMSKVSSVLNKGVKYGAVAAAAAAAGLFVAINKTALSMDELAKKARAINFPIEEFQEWRFVSEQSGVSADVFDKSLEKFTKTVGELKGGYGSMLTALKKTDRPLIRQLKSTNDVSSALDLYLEAIRKTPDAAGKAALATAAFGRAGVRMINVANNSADEIGKLRQQMRENGVVTAEQAAKAEAYNDMMNRVRLTIKGVAVDALSPLMPIMTEGMDKMRQWIVKNREFLKTKLAEYIKKIGDYFSRIGKTLLPVLKAAVPYIKKIPEYLEKMVEYGPAIMKGVAAFYALNAVVKIISVSMTAFNMLMNIPFGKVKSLAVFMGSTLPLKIGMSTAAVTAMQTALVGLGGAVAAIGLSYLFYEHLLKPLMLARKEAERLKQIHDAMMAKDDLSKKKSVDLKKDISTANKLIQNEKKSFSGNVAVMPYAPMGFDPLAGARNEAVSKLQRDKRKIETAFYANRQAENIARFAVDPISSQSDFTFPTRTESFEREEVVVTIKDETGRARVTKGKSRNLNLVHTGGMP